jgi:hypothetical protein
VTANADKNPILLGLALDEKRDSGKPTFLKFSSIKRKFPTTDRGVRIQQSRAYRKSAEACLADILKTMTIKFLKPRKLGAASES